MKRAKKHLWEDIPREIKRIIRCKSCGKRIEVLNFNRKLCEECGYRGDYNKNG